MEEANVQAARGHNRGRSKTLSTPPELKLHEFRVEKYNGLVRALKPGCLTIVLLVDSQSRAKLLPAFHKAIWPYRYFFYIILLIRKKKKKNDKLRFIKNY